MSDRERILDWMRRMQHLLDAWSEQQTKMLRKLAREEMKDNE